MSTQTSANTAMKMSPAARAGLRTGEKVVLRYYNDMKKKGGNCTWGTGILAHRGICSQEELERKVSLDDVNKEFEHKVREAEGTVRRRVRVPLTQAQFDALVSLTYNTGSDGASDTFKLVNSGDFNGAADNIASMTNVRIKRHGKSVLVPAPGLFKRRAAESAPFRTDDKLSKGAEK